MILKPLLVAAITTKGIISIRNTLDTNKIDARSPLNQLSASLRCFRSNIHSTIFFFSNPNANIHNVVLLSTLNNNNNKQSMARIVLQRCMKRFLLAFRLVHRFLYLSLLFVPLIVTYPVWHLMEASKLELWAPASTYSTVSSNPSIPLRKWWLHWLVWALEASGPTFIKVKSINFCLGV